MKISLAISEAAKANPGESRIGRLAGTLSKPSALAVGAGIILQRVELTVLQGKMDPLLAKTASLDLELTAAAMLAAYAGGAFIMSLKEKIMKPLMDAQFKKGIATATAEFEAWKERQEAAGVVFVPDPEDETEEPEAK